MWCSDKVERYKNKEFCISIMCENLSKNKKKCKILGCTRDAKQFHHWLNQNNYCISKCIKASDRL